MSQSFHLFQLQKIDSQIDQNDRRIAEIHEILEDRSQQKAMQETKGEKQNTFATHSMEMKKLEHEVEQKKIKIEQTNNSLFSGKISNPKELQDLQNEVASLKKAITALEEEQLEKLILLESAENELNSFDETLKNFQADAIEKNSGLQGEASQLKAQNHNLVKEREIVVGQIEKQVLGMYEELRRKKKGIAVSEIVETVCTACGSELTPAECQKARSPSALVFCSFCGRILYST